MNQGLKGFADGVVADGKGTGQFRFRRNAVSNLPFAGPYHGFHGGEHLAGQGHPHRFLQLHCLGLLHEKLSDNGPETPLLRLD